MSKPVDIEILIFAGCPNGEPAAELVEQAVRSTGIEATVTITNVETRQAALTERFLGSPTIRVAGVDIEPGADTRTDFVLSCRVYRTAEGFRGLPDERWLTAALAAAATS